MDISRILHHDKISTSTLKNWVETYDNFSLQNELENASNWLQESNKKFKSYPRFYGNWLRKSAIKKTKYTKEEIKHFFTKESKEWPKLFTSIGMKENEE